MTSADRDRIGIGLVGTGVAARMHAESLGRTSTARVVAVADIDEARARTFADEWHIPRAYGNAQDLIADAEVEAVHLCTPPYLREPLTRACAGAGKHVMAEKPMARDLPEADAMIEVCRRAGVQLAVVFNHRFMPLPRRLKDGLVEGVLGRVFLAEGHVKWWRASEYYGGSDWRGTEAKEGGGILINQAIHTIDLLLWLLGPVSEVTGYTTRGLHAIECEDTAVAVVQFQSGALATLSASTAAYPGASERLELYGTQGSVLLAESDGIVEWRLRGGRQWRDDVGVAGETGRDPASLALDGHVAQFEDFAAAIRAGRRPAVDGVEGRKALELVRAVYLANRKRLPVQLPVKDEA